jgi:hypothetical protein
MATNFASWLQRNSPKLQTHFMVCFCTCLYLASDGDRRSPYSLHFWASSLVRACNPSMSSFIPQGLFLVSFSYLLWRWQYVNPTLRITRLVPLLCSQKGWAILHRSHALPPHSNACRCARTSRHVQTRITIPLERLQHENVGGLRRREFLQP